MSKVRFSVDRGGTFTDVYAEKLSSSREDEVEESFVLKLLSEDPANYEDAPREGIRRVLEKFYGEKLPREQPVRINRIASIRMGTTVATNALLERKGARFVLLTTKGFRDLWHIGNQTRPDIFDLAIKCPETLYESVEEIDERIVLGSGDVKNVPELDVKLKQKAVSGEEVTVEREVNEQEVTGVLEKLKKQGIKSIAVVFMHSALYPEHELIVGRLAEKMGCFEQISLSHKVMQMVKIVPRGYTSIADAYLTPHISRYLETFKKGFEDGFLENVNVSFMQSDGGLTRVDHFSGHKAILSGPAGGVVGYALTTRLADGAEDTTGEVVGFDMGGTSTDVSRYAGHYEHVFETTTAGVTIQAPQLDIHTVAAGGGSKLKYNSGIFSVGPESVGAHPGPVCYRKGGELAVTDANVALGRLLPEYFPAIFGPNENEPLDAEASIAAFRELMKQINSEIGEGQKEKTMEEVAFGFIKVANEAMCRPIRNLTQMRGFDISRHVLASFGGAGGQHACAIARSLGMKKVFVHRCSGILSAFGIGLADVVQDVQEPSALVLSEGSLDAHDEKVAASFQKLSKEATEALLEQGMKEEKLKFEFFLNLRYTGTDSSMMTRLENAAPPERFVKEFKAQYKREYGFDFAKRDIVIDDGRVRVSGLSNSRLAQEKEVQILRNRGCEEGKNRKPPEILTTKRVFFDGEYFSTPVYRLEEVFEEKFSGPAILLDANSTIVVEPGCNAIVSPFGDVTIDLIDVKSEFATLNDRVDPIQLALFSHRFMGIAEQMGRTLQRTSNSVNIKERLDFSCALFGPDGGLVANAPHIPVHLGAMSEAIRFQHDMYKDGKNLDIRDGDVLVSNHPQLAGGSHLPDITVITPCFSNGELVFWVASRGHHADVGGITPGSMPPTSRCLADEGAAIVSFKLVENGEFQEDGISKLLTTPANPNNPECRGTRSLQDNLSDLRAQVAANNHGVALVNELIEECGLGVVQAYMSHIQRNAEKAVRSMLKSFVKKKGVDSVYAEDFMDDGTKIAVRIKIDSEEGSAEFDFSGTGSQVEGNCNAPPAVTFSAIIYSLRSLVAETIPLNQGCLAPVKIHIPEGTILNPSKDCAVVGGNVLTSQRVVDVILKAFEACAASQGCMNNLSFGDASFGYYETIAGGAGAGPTWDGRSGVHTHMTNTRITDPEIFERRLPVILRQFSLRPNSGGIGVHRGGDGVKREIEFLRPVTVSILSERRVHQPPGILGGSDGAKGKNFLSTKKNGEFVSLDLGGKNSVHVDAGSRISIHTPGGGGYGKP